MKNEINQFNSEREKLKERLIKTTGGITNNDRKLLKIYTNFLPEDSCFGERRQYLINDYSEIQKCPVCGKKRKYSKSEKKLSVFCSNECRLSEKGIEISNNNEAQNYIKSHKVADSEEELREKIINEIGYKPNFLTDNETNIILKFTSFLSDDEDTPFNERIYYFINNIKEVKNCPVCGKKVYFIEKRRDLSVFCSKECKFSKEGQSLRLENERKSILKNHIEKSENYKEAETKEELKEKIKNFSNPANWMHCLTKKEIDLLIKITNFLPKDVSMSERQCYLLNDYTETKLCPVCGKRAKYLSNHHRIGLFCSIECMRSEKGEKIRGAKIGNTRSEIKVKDPKRFAEIKERTEKTNFEKYGGPAPCSNKDISDRGKRKRREKYFKTFLKEIDLCNLTYISSFEEYCNAKIGDKLKFKCNFCGKIFEYIVDSHLLEVKRLKCPYCQIYKFSSSYEQEIYDWLCSEGFTNIKRNKRFYINQKRLEADIFLPDYNLAIEFNGIYWHSDFKKDSNYHYQKWSLFRDNKIDCIQIFENEWVYNKNVIKDIILKKLNVYNKIDSSLCYIKELSVEEYRSFLKNNYYKDALNADIILGLYQKDKIVEIISFSKSKDEKWELKEHCSKLGIAVVDGFLKLLDYFKNNISNSSIIFYIDSRYFDKDNYKDCGFKYHCHTKPNKFYIYSGYGAKKFFDSTEELIDYHKEGTYKTSNKRKIKYLSIYDAGYDVLVLE